MMFDIHTATDDDIVDLYRIAEDMQAKHESNYFERCIREQGEEKRVVLMATHAGRAIGYTQLVWSPMYSTFRRLGIPEVQDLNVIPDMRGKGVGRGLVLACEKIVRDAGKPEIGISVGLDQSYGPAQRLYVKMGYIPDGTGVCCDEIPVRKGELRATLLRHPISLDNLLTIKMVKSF